MRLYNLTAIRQRALELPREFDHLKGFCDRAHGVESAPDLNWYWTHRTISSFTSPLAGLLFLCHPARLSEVTPILSSRPRERSYPYSVIPTEDPKGPSGGIYGNGSQRTPTQLHRFLDSLPASPNGLRRDKSLARNDRGATDSRLCVNNVVSVSVSGHETACCRRSKRAGTR